LSRSWKSSAPAGARGFCIELAYAFNHAVMSQPSVHPVQAFTQIIAPRLE
jgi:hypothetical protein